MICNQSQIQPGFFAYALQFFFYDGNNPKSLFLFPCIRTSPNRPLYITEDCHLRANLKNRTFVMRENPVSTGELSKSGASRRGKPDFCLPYSLKIGARGTESRQKPVEMPHFCLPPAPNSTRAVLKVDKKRWKCLILSTAAYKFGPRYSESRTKSSKIEKMFYSVTFAKAVWSQIAGKFQKAPFCP